jgi:hypothetical protein
MNRKQIQVYSTTIDRIYYVSMGYRQSSAIYNPVWYYELFVWKCDSNGYAEKIVYETDAGSRFKDALSTHNRIVKIFIYLVERNLRNKGVNNNDNQKI